jgi:hypothetical protein
MPHISDFFLAEASFDECKLVLGWKINTRSFTIHLPENKFIAWYNEINTIISKKQATPTELHSIKGRLNHAAYLIPTMRHFFSRIRALQMICEKSNKKIAFLPNPVLDDLILCNNFLYWAKNGIFMNLVSSRYPSIFLRSDACEYGLGGYNT